MASRTHIFSALSEPARIRILFALRSGQRNAGDLAGQLAVPRSTLSFHLRILCEAGLTERLKHGRERWYRLTPTVRRRRENLFITTPDIRLTLQGGPDV